MLRRALLTAVLALAAAASYAAVSVGMGDLLARPEAFDGKTVAVAGKAGRVQAKTSKAGRAYTVFPLWGKEKGQKVGVFAWGHPDVKEGAYLTVTGVYKKEKVVGTYTFTNEIEAEEIR